MAAELKRFQPTAGQLALSEERKRKKQKQVPQSLVDDAKGRILFRDWIDLDQGNGVGESRSVKLLTWNLLAQCLVRRDLFPTSNCLKAGQREHMLYREILSHEADILCLQEVDRLEKLLPVLDDAGYAYTYKAGPRKKHGCLVAYRKDMYDKVDEKVIIYDEQEVRQAGNERACHGASFRTKNIASIVALRRSSADSNEGFIVATTHLFWHPRYTYERARQAGIMVREVSKFRADSEAYWGWPCILAGDFNFAPNDAAYSLLVGDTLSLDQEASLQQSRVVHQSIDPTVSVEEQGTTIDDDEGAAEKDPDKIITNARRASPADGLLSTPELVDLFSTSSPLQSAYDDGQRIYRASGAEVATFGDRVGLPLAKRGAHEPEWTSYTHYWKTVLDYIFILDAPDRPSVVTGISKPHRTEDLEPGIPQQGICASDHISLCAQLLWSDDYGK